MYLKFYNFVHDGSDVCFLTGFCFFLRPQLSSFAFHEVDFLYFRHQLSGICNLGQYAGECLPIKFFRMDLIFATHNQNKAEEINKLLGSSWNVRSLDDAGFHEDIPETGSTLEENALQKARFVWNELGVTCFADDTGLEIDFLDGAPGVYSARFAGPEKDSIQNMEKVLKEMKDVTNRKARFRTVIALIVEGEEVLFEGSVDGEILQKMSGDQGFGYDPIFQPDEADVSFACMSLLEKNQISHRGQAIKKLVDYLESIKNQ